MRFIGNKQGYGTTMRIKNYKVLYLLQQRLENFVMLVGVHNRL